MPKLHGKNVRVYLDGYDLSGDSTSVERGVPGGGGGPAGGTTGVDMGAGYIATSGTVTGHLQLFTGTGTITLQSSTAAGTNMVWTGRIPFGVCTAPLGKY